MQEPDPHLIGLLERCQADPAHQVCAMIALEKHKQRGLRIARSGLTDDEKERHLLASRETLRTDLCDILEPMNVANYPAPATSPPGTRQTHQTEEQP